MTADSQWYAPGVTTRAAYRRCWGARFGSYWTQKSTRCPSTRHGPIVSTPSPSSSLSSYQPGRGAIGTRPDGTRSVTVQQPETLSWVSPTSRVTMTVASDATAPAGATARLNVTPVAPWSEDASRAPSQRVLTTTLPVSGASRNEASWVGVRISSRGRSGVTVTVRVAPSALTVAEAPAPGTWSTHDRAAIVRWSVDRESFGGFASRKASRSAAMGSPSAAAAIP